MPGPQARQPRLQCTSGNERSEWQQQEGHEDLSRRGTGAWRHSAAYNDKDQYVQ